MFRFPKKNKYHNKSCKCGLGHIHDSRGESRFCDELSLMVKAKEIQSFRTQRKYDLWVTGDSGERERMGYMRVDFEVVNKNGETEIFEYKGMSTPAWRLKCKLFAVCYPQIKYNVVWHKERR